MATSFVELDGRGFWCHDSLLEIWAHLMSEVLGDAGTQSLAEYGDYLHLQATAGFRGCIDLRFDDFDAEGREEIVRQAACLLARLRMEPGLLTARHLNELGLGGGEIEYTDVPIEYLQALTKHMVMLVRGEWPWGAGDKESLPGQWLDDERTRNADQGPSADGVK